MSKREIPVKKNDVVEVEITDLTYEGLGVAKVDGYPLFVTNALPGEVAVLRVIKTGKNFGYARVTKLKNTSPDRVEERGNAYAQTGIMPLQHLSYPAQLQFKRQQVVNNLERTAHLHDVPVAETIGMEKPFGYRNKAQIPVREISGKLETGFFKKNSHTLLPLEDFVIQDPKIDEAVVVIRDILREYHIEPYNEQTNSGVIRHIMIRRGYYSHEMMVILVTRSKKIHEEEEIVAAITKALPEVVGIVQNINRERTNVILGRSSRTLYGQDYLTDQLFGLDFKISAHSFYQINPLQTQVLYQTAIDFAELSGNETVIDAYSGIGTISLALAKHAKQVYGVELVDQAVDDARENAKSNGIENVSFEVGKAEDVMKTWQEAGLKADVLIVDPPRKGLEPEFIGAVGFMQPKRLVYVSCNPATFARDVALFKEQGYKLEKVQPVDMFPQTHHVELVGKFTHI